MASSKYRKIKVGSIRRKKIIILLITISLLFVSVGYSYLNSELGFSGTLFVNQYYFHDPFRISNIELIDKKNDGNENNSPNYSSNRTSMNVSLPNTDSSITYRVTIENNTGSYFTPGEIKTITNTNANVKYTIDRLESYGVYQGNTYTFNITFTSSLDNQESMLTLEYDFKTVTDTVWNFDYTGGAETFGVPYTANYKIELWGAEGGRNYGETITGKGAYVRGNVILNKGIPLYVFVGEKPTYVSGNCYDTNPNNAFNGSVRGSCVVGGGATDIRLIKSTNWYDSNSLRSRIMVAGAGGGIYYTGKGGDGGELNGGDSTGRASDTYSPGLGATQTKYGFGYSDHQTTVGGGGYYSGQSGYAANAGGGSSYISGYKGCIAITSLSDETPICTESNALNDVTCSYHYSGYKFTDMLMIGGNKSMTSPSGSTEIGHTGNGYARITLIPSS